MPELEPTTTSAECNAIYTALISSKLNDAPVDETSLSKGFTLVNQVLLKQLRPNLIARERVANAGDYVIFERPSDDMLLKHLLMVLRPYVENIELLQRLTSETQRQILQFLQLTRAISEVCSAGRHIQQIDKDWQSEGYFHTLNTKLAAAEQVLLEQGKLKTEMPIHPSTPKQRKKLGDGLHALVEFENGKPIIKDGLDIQKFVSVMSSQVTAWSMWRQDYARPKWCYTDHSSWTAPTTVAERMMWYVGDACAQENMDEAQRKLSKVYHFLKENKAVMLVILAELVERRGLRENTRSTGAIAEGFADFKSKLQVILNNGVSDAERKKHEDEWVAEEILESLDTMFRQIRATARALGLYELVELIDDLQKVCPNPNPDRLAIPEPWYNNLKDNPRPLPKPDSGNNGNAVVATEASVATDASIKKSYPGWDSVEEKFCFSDEESSEESSYIWNCWAFIKLGFFLVAATLKSIIFSQEEKLEEIEENEYDEPFSDDKQPVLTNRAASAA